MKRDVVIGLIAAVVVVAAGLTALRWNGAPWAPEAPPGAGSQAAVANKPPPAPAAPAAGPVAPSFDVVRINPQGEAVIAGRAAPGAEVTIFDGGKPVGQATANQDGQWVFLPKEPLPPGNHELSLSAKTPDGTATGSDGVVAMVVPPRAPQPGAGAQAPSNSLAVLVPRQGGGAARALQLPREAAGSRRLVLDVIEYDASGKVQLLGRADPGAEIRAYLDDRPAGKGKAEASGGWSVILDQPVPVGRYRLRLDALDGNGKTLAEIALNFGRVAPPEGAVAVDIQPGNNLWRIAQRSYGDGLRYTEIYQANKSQIRDPNLIYPGQIVAVPGRSRNQ